jgi:hypothetical protein
VQNAWHKAAHWGRRLPCTKYCYGIRWTKRTGHAERLAQSLFWKPEERSSLMRHRRMRYDNIKVDLTVTCVMVGIEFIWLRIGCSGALVNTVMNLRVPKMAGNFLTNRASNSFWMTSPHEDVTRTMSPGVQQLTECDRHPFRIYGYEKRWRTKMQPLHYASLFGPLRRTRKNVIFQALGSPQYTTIISCSTACWPTHLPKRP